jgi:predicted RNA-binding Zn-ribbon protein involved in translation (DUF1610 family)
MMADMCTKCKVEMRKLGKMQSGNSTFVELQCPKCGVKKMKAEGSMK